MGTGMPDLQVETGREFKNVSFAEQRLENRRYESCTFTGCNFSGVFFRACDFEDTVFDGCNLALAVPEETGFHRVRFVGSKLTGVDFGRSRDLLFSPAFERCDLDYALFPRKRLKGVRFDGSTLRGAIFSDCDLSEAVFDGCDLTDTLFGRCNLERADFTGALHYVIDPENNRMKNAAFAPEGLAGLLRKYGLNIG